MSESKKLRMYAARHGNAVANKVDIRRCLSEKGVQQASDLNMWGRNDEHHGNWGQILVSHAPRAWMTAEIVTGKPAESMIFIPAIYPEPANSAINQRFDVLYGELGNKSVQAYRDADDGADTVLKVGDAIWSEVDRHWRALEQPEIISIFGHGTSTQAMLIAACGGPDGMFSDELLKLVLNECNCIWIDFDVGPEGALSPIDFGFVDTDAAKVAA